MMIELTVGRAGYGYGSGVQKSYVNTEHIVAVVPATKYSMDDAAQSDVILVDGTKIHAHESPPQVMKLLTEAKP